MKRALITGVCGQDGSYLAEYLLGLGYHVFGLVRRPIGTLQNLTNQRLLEGKIEFIYGDLRDQESLYTAIGKAYPDEIYNLGAQVFVPTSWTRPDATFDINVGGLARILEIVERVKPDTRIYQASTSEMYGNASTVTGCDEMTPMFPQSPYGVAKYAAHNLCRIYRARGIYVVSGILFNHESPRRGIEMVTRKISRHVAACYHGGRTPLHLGNLLAERDWGFAGEYVVAMHKMLQLEQPEDFVIGTGQKNTVGDFLTKAMTVAGIAALPKLVVSSKDLVRKNEIHTLLANASKAKAVLGWEPKVTFIELVTMMVRHDIDNFKW